MIVEDKDTLSLVEKAILVPDLTLEEQTDWLENMGKSLGRWYDAEDFTILSQAEILQTVWSIWEETRNEYGVSLSKEVTGKWQYDFYCWAKRYRKKRVLREPDQQTIDNQMATYRDWSSGIINTPKEIFIPKRNDEGEIISTDDETTWEKVDFDWKLCDYGKLFISKSYAKKGAMTPDAWAALRDPHATANDLKIALKGESEKTHKPKDDFRLWEQDGVIYATKDEKTISIAQILFENEDSELFKRGINHLLQAAGCKPYFEFAE